MKFIKFVLRALVIIFGLIFVGILVKRLRPAPVVSIDYGSVSDFSLLDQTGATFTLNSLKGHAWIANFIFTRCQGPCPLISYKTSQLQKEIPASTGLQFVSISVDPEYDTPPILSAYAASYPADADRRHFLTGKKSEVYALIRKSFRLSADEDTSREDKADFVHSTFFVIVDKDGFIRGYYDSTDNAAFEKLKNDLKKWI